MSGGAVSRASLRGSLSQYSIIYQGSQVHRHKFIVVVYVAGETSAIPEFPPFGAFHSYHLESGNGAKLGMENVHRPPHTWMMEGALCRRLRSCHNICLGSSASAPRGTHHTAKKERNARAITTATEPSPTPTICCSVSDEAFT